MIDVLFGKFLDLEFTVLYLGVCLVRQSGEFEEMKLKVKRKFGFCIWLVDR